MNGFPRSSFEENKKKIVFITGAASGIGKATTELFSRTGAEVFSVDLTFQRGKSIRVTGNTIEYGCDLTSAINVRSALNECERSYGGIHVVVNCAGIEMKGTVVDLSEESYDRVMDTNVKSIFLVCKYALPILRKTSNIGSIINLSSDLGIQPIPGVDAYAASKGAIIALTKAMSKNWARSGLRINCIAPGPIDTPLLKRFQDEKTLGFVKEVMLPQGRVGTPEEIAEIIAFLASERSSLINGAVITANGGLVG